jgi:hypothetical protein
MTTNSESDPVSPDSERGTSEYSSDTREYPSPKPPSGQAMEALRREQPWWRREGYSTLADALADEIAMRDRVMGRKPRDLKGLSLEAVIFSQPERTSRRKHRRRTRARQVNVKLTEEEHMRLKEAARGYGLPPSTLARVFVIRATEVALK